MATNQLNVTAGSGSQSQATAGTSNLQPTGQTGNTNTDSGSVQPGTATALLGGTGGVTLHNPTLPTVSLTNTAPVTVSTPLASTSPKHHVNPAFFGFSALLLVVAIVLFWNTSRSVKNTTQY